MHTYMRDMSLRLTENNIKYFLPDQVKHLVREKLSSGRFWIAWKTVILLKGAEINSQRVTYSEK